MKNRQTRILAFFLSLVMVLQMLPAIASAEGSAGLGEAAGAQAPSAIVLKDIACTQGEPIALDGSATTGDSGTITYQWYQSADGAIDAPDAAQEDKNDVLLPGETGAVLARDNLAQGVYYYFVVATNTATDGQTFYTAQTTSNVAEVRVSLAESGQADGLGETPRPASDPADQQNNGDALGIALTSGEESFDGRDYAKRMTLTATGTGGLTINNSGFRWQYSASENGPWEDIEDGGSASQLTLRVALGGAAINGFYRCAYTHQIEDQDDAQYTSAPIFVSLENPIRGVYINPQAENEEDVDGNTIKHRGSDQNHGYSPIMPVQSLRRAIEQYNNLLVDESVHKTEDLRIFVLNPIEIAGDTGGADGFWPEGITLQRYQNNGYLFKVTGGTLTLSGISLETDVQESSGGSLEPLFNLEGGRLNAKNTDIPSVAVTDTSSYVGDGTPAITVSGQPESPISVLIVGETEGQRIRLLADTADPSLADAGKYVNIVSENWKAEATQGVITATYDSGVVAGNAVYLDGANGDDKNTGTAPGDAVKTFARALELVTEDGTIYICGTVTLKDGDAIDASSKPGVILRRSSGFSGNLFTVAAGTANTSRTTATIEGITVDGGGLGNSISASQFVNLTVKDTVLRNGARGIYYESSSAGASITLQNVTITGNTSDGIYLIHANGSSTDRGLTVNIIGSDISRNGGRGIHTNVGGGFKDVTITDTTISENGSGGIHLQGGFLKLYGSTCITNNKGIGVSINRAWNAWSLNQRGLIIADDAQISGNTSGALSFSNARGSENNRHFSYLTLTGGSIEGKITVNYSNGSSAINYVNWAGTKVEGMLSLTDGIPIRFSQHPSAIGNAAYQLTLDKYYTAGTVVAQMQDGTALTQEDFNLFSAAFPAGSDNLRIGLEKGKIVVIDTNYIYVDPVDGSDDNDGSSPGNAVKTMEAAIAAVNANAADRETIQKIAVMGAIPVDTTASWDGQVGTQQITVTPYGTIDGPFLNVKAGGALTLANMTFDCMNNQKYGFTVSGGALTMGANTALNNTTDLAVTISGGSFAMTENAKFQNGYRAIRITAGSFTMGGTSSIKGFKINDGFISASSSARITLKDNAIISGNTNTVSGYCLIEMGGSSKLIMEGSASITGNSVGGGIVRVGGSASMEMSGGSITSNTAARTDRSNTCGGVWVEGIFTMTGGTISGNNHAISTQPFNSVHKDVYLNGGGKLRLGGSAVIANPILLTSDSAISVVQQMTDEASITLYPAETLVGKTVASMTNSVSAEESLPQFHIASGLEDVYALSANAADTAILLINPNQDVYLSSAGNDANDGKSTITPVATFARAKELVGEGRQIIICGQVNISGTQEWDLSDKTGVSVRRAVNYTGVLVNVTAGHLTMKNIAIDGDKASNLNSCSEMLKLSGGSVTLGASAILQNNRGRIVSMTGGTLNLQGGSLRNSTSQAINATGGSIIMSGGSISGNAAENPSSGASGVVYLQGGNTSMRIAGGSITGNSLSGYDHAGYAASVVVNDSAQLVMQGGTIAGDSAQGARQSSVYAAGNGIVSMTSGTISGRQPVLVGSNGIFTMSGGNITQTYQPSSLNATVTVASAGSFSMSGGTVHAGYGAYTGLAGINVNSGGTLSMTGGTITKASSSTAANACRGIVNAGTANISGGAITAMNDSGIINTAGTLTISGTAQITSNSAASGGGVRGTGGNIIVSGGTIAGNKATSTGGGIYANGANLTISGGMIGGAQAGQANTATSYGGGVYFANSARTLTMTDGSIAGNTANSLGGGLYLLENYRANLTGGSISGNTASYGGGIYSRQGTFTAQGTDITGNTATNSGGGLCVSGGSTAYLSTGTAISGNTALMGGGLLVETQGTKVTLSGAQITGNQASNSGGGFYLVGNAVVEAVSGTVSGNTASANASSTGFYVTTGDLQLRGGGTQMDDTIYLDDKNHPITLTYGINGSNTYTVAVNTGSFAIGDPVVTPSRINVMDAGQYLRSFTLLAASNMTLISSDSDLILSRCYFVGGSSASDDNDGTAPGQAFATIEKALLALAQDKVGTIYICGNVELSEDLTLGSDITLRPYTGFAVGGNDTSVPAYTGTLITVKGGTLSLAGAHVLGSENASGPLFAAESGTISITGGEIRDHGGLAVEIAAGGTLSLAGGSITGCTDDAENAIKVGGTLELSGNPALIGGQIYLEADKVISITGELNLPRMITVDMQNASAGKMLATTGSADIAASASSQFHLAAGLSGLYRVSVSGSDLILAAKSKVYLDPVSGSDSNNGANPAKAVQTLRRAYELVQDTGGAIYIMNTVVIADSTTLTANSYSSASGAVSAGDTVDFLRYVKPTQNLTNYEAASCPDALFSVAGGGALTLDGVSIDGHHVAVTSGNAEDITTAFTASAPLITAAGALKLNNASLNNNTSDAATGGAVNITGNGTLEMTGANSIADALDASGTAIFHGGDRFYLAGEPAIQGSVYLAADKFISSQTSLAIADALGITMQKAESGAIVVDYGTAGYASSAPELKKFAVANANGLYLTGNAGKNALILGSVANIYVDGQNGSDDNTGYAPAAALKSLSNAVQKAKELGGGAQVVVVNQVDIARNVAIEDAVIVRYEKPDNSIVEGFDVESYDEGVLVNVTSGATLTLNNGAVLGANDASAASIAEGGALALSDGSTVGGVALEAGGTLTLSGSLTAGVIALAEDAYITEGADLNASITLKPAKTDAGTLLAVNSSPKTKDCYSLERSIALANNTALFLFHSDLYIAAKTSLAILPPANLLANGSSKEASAKLTRLDTNHTVSDAPITLTYYTDASYQTPTTAANGALEPGGAPAQAGIYYVRAIYAGDATSGLMPAQASASFTVKQTVSVDDAAQTFTYNGQPHSFELRPTPAGLGGFTVAYQVDGSWTTTAPTNAGSYHVKVSRPEDAMYASFEQEIPFGLVIAPRELTITGASEEISKTYDGRTSINSSPTLMFNGAVENDDVGLAYTGAAYADKNAGMGKTVIFSGIALIGADAANYTVANTFNTTGKIAALPVQITWDYQQAFVYDQKEHTVTPAIANALTGDTVSIQAVESATQIHYGEYTAQVSALGGADAANYTLDGASGTQLSWQIIREKLTGITAPTDKTLDRQYDSADAVIATLPAMVDASKESGSTTLSITWKLKDGEAFDNSTGGSNTYVWTASVPDLLDPNGVPTTGEITVSNQGASLAPAGRIDGQTSITLSADTSANATILTAILTDGSNGALAYQWQKWNGSAWENLSGKAEKSLPLSGLTMADNGAQYRCVVTNTESGKAPASANLGPAVLRIEKGAQSAPNAAAAQPIIIGGTGAITGLTTDMEYSTDGKNWIKVSGSQAAGGIANIPADTVYQIRYSETPYLYASPAQTLTIRAFVPFKEPTPNGSFQADAMLLQNVEDGQLYSVDDGATWLSITDESISLANAGLADGSAILIKKPGNGLTTIDSDVQTIALTQAERPAGMATDETAYQKKDGTIAIADYDSSKAYQISADNGATWADAEADAAGKILGLAPGGYVIRIKGSGTMLASEPSEMLTVGAYIRSSSKEITAFVVAVDGTEYAAAIEGTDITLTLPYRSVLTGLTPAITHTGVSISPDNAAQDFTRPVIYTVTAEDGTTKSYTAVITVAPPFAYTLTPDAGMTHGTITSNPSSPIAEDAEVTLSIAADQGYQMKEGTLRAYKSDDMSIEVSIADYKLTMPGFDVVVTAEFEPIVYTITYDLADGALAQGAENPSTYTVQSAAITLNNPTRSGYTFAGWAGTGLSGAVTTVVIPAGSMGDRTYTAIWNSEQTPDCFTLTFDANGGSSVDSLQAEAGARIALNQVTKREGYLFTGWYLDAALTEKADFVHLTRDMTVYAGWKKEEPNNAIPKTGDSSNPALLILLMSASAAALIGAYAYSRKKKYNG